MTSRQFRARDALLLNLNRIVRDTRVAFSSDGGAFFAGPAERPVEVTLRIVRPRFYERVFFYSNLGLAEAFMDRDFELSDGTLREFLTILLRNRADWLFPISGRLVARMCALLVRNAVRGKIGNVRKRYEGTEKLYETFLDSTLTYGCGYALDPSENIDEMQRNKLHRICQKLGIGPGDSLADLGCGYGSMLLYAAERFGATGTGITINKGQIERALEEAARRGLTDRVQLIPGDYRRLEGKFDRVVSVEMLEHLPPRDYRRFFRTMARVLKPGGFGLLQVGCRSLPGASRDPFSIAYTAAGVRHPRLSEVAHELVSAGLLILDVENIVRHYHLTVMGWLRNFEDNRSRLAREYDDHFLRMWEYHLSGGAAAGLASDFSSYQVLFTNDRAASLPLQRV
jgi:cyclopropane-fatty-acyl-phospholipid synthase